MLAAKGFKTFNKADKIFKTIILILLMRQLLIEYFSNNWINKIQLCDRFISTKKY